MQGRPNPPAPFPEKEGGAESVFMASGPREGAVSGGSKQPPHGGRSLTTDVASWCGLSLIPSASYNRDMSTITLQELVNNPATLLKRVEAGEAIVVTRDGQAIAELRPVTSGSPVARPIGLAAGEFTVPDDFDSPLPDEILRAFEGR